jgi:long-chain acyl-CoA synthetase
MAETLIEMFQETVRNFPDSPALSRKTEEGYRTITYREMDSRMQSLARGLSAMGIRKGDRVALMSENRPEWAITDLAILRLGAVNVAIFPSLTSQQAHHIIADSGSRTIIVSTVAQVTKALAIREEVKDLAVIAMDVYPESTPGVFAFEDVLNKGSTERGFPPGNDAGPEAVGPGDWASIIYTSGTTGDPRGAILTHRNFVSNIESARAVLSFKPGETLLSFVPLNHAMGRLVDHYLPIRCGACVAYVESLLHLRLNMREVKPHYMVVVPRVLEVFREGILAEIGKRPPLARKIFSVALSIGLRYCDLMQKGRTAPSHVRFGRFLAENLVYRKIRNRLGLNRLRLFFSGGASLPVSTAMFFCAMGFIVMEGYGLTETSPLVAVNPPDRVKFGTVGLPVKGVQVRTGDGGEICVKGPNVMSGYYNRLEETAEAFGPDGWFRTGDVGEFDEDGYLRIADRKKNLLVLSNGEKVAPSPIELQMMESPYIAWIILVGSGQNTIGAIIVPSFQRLKEWVRGMNIQPEPEDRRALIALPGVRALIRSELDRLSTDLAEFQKIRRFALMEEDLTVENGTLTPTLKVRRNVVTEKYRDLIDAMYRVET